MERGEEICKLEDAPTHGEFQVSCSKRVSVELYARTKRRYWGKVQRAHIGALARRTAAKLAMVSGWLFF
jgi:hypothetical protein